jgi:hypothetical protein
MHYKFKTKPFEHQQKALDMSWNKENFAYFMEMGTGKSKVLIDNMAMLYAQGKIVHQKVYIKTGMTQKYLHIYLIILNIMQGYGEQNQMINYLNRCSHLKQNYIF